VAADSPLLSTATLAKLQPPEAALVPRLARVLLLQHSKRLKQGEAGLATAKQGFLGASTDARGPSRTLIAP
jgi:hypothetical protein